MTADPVTVTPACDGHPLKLLVLTDHYYPATAAGGPPKGIRSALLDSVGLSAGIICRDRDHLASQPYGPPFAGIVEVDKMTVTYLSLNGLRNALAATLLIIRSVSRADVIWVNSLHSLFFGVVPLLLKAISPRLAVLLSPRGELAPTALARHSYRKAAWHALFQGLGLHRRVTWIASSPQEERDINCSFKGVVARLVPERTLLAGRAFVPKLRDGPLRLLCLGRVTPVKGIKEGLRILAHVQTEVCLTIAGAIEDPEYQIELQRLAAGLPRNVAVDWLGPVPAESVPALIQRHDALFSPTRGENFGHSIAESLALGRPVITTAQTPWSFAESTGSVIHLDTVQVRESAARIDNFARTGPVETFERQERAYGVGLRGIKGGMNLSQVISAITNIDCGRGRLWRRQ